MLIAVALQRSDALWCGARGIPAGTLLRSRGFALDAMPDLEGRVALVTGANTGLGFAVARELLAANATVLLACRDAHKCETAARSLGRPSRTRTLAVDLDDVRSVVAAAARVRRTLPALHVLVLNAGVATQFPLALTADGVERTFASNCASPPLLTRAPRAPRHLER
jgi:NAD(P)-dependent dehydrogenase (short-subunit alcohol dehydrogenase family)